MFDCAHDNKKARDEVMHKTHSGLDELSIKVVNLLAARGFHAIMSKRNRRASIKVLCSGTTYAVNICSSS